MTMTLAQLLLEQRDDIVARFVKEVAKHLSPEGLSQSVLTDHIPIFLEDIAAEFEDGRSVRPLVGVDPDDIHDGAPHWLSAVVMPRRTDLMRLDALASFEPRRSENPASGRFLRKPTQGGRAFSRPLTRPSDATGNPVRRAAHPLSGHSVRAWRGS